jgi:tRNA threonylcarbamoyladenosine biosynthesis protein TsaB
VIMTLKTASPTTELQLFKPDGNMLLDDVWKSDRQLSSQLLEHLSGLLGRQHLTWDALTGLVVFRGPGSFTGLRIGATVANAIAYAQEIPIVGTIGEDWVETGLQRLASGESDTQVVPHYGAPPNITKPKSSA